MAAESRSVSVLIVDGDLAIRRMIAAILEQAGFRAYTEDDGRREYAVIVRDVNLTPGKRDDALQQLAATAPEVLRRTIVLTTAPARAAKTIRGVFAIIGKPFDLDDLVDAVTRCAGTPLKLDAVRRFVSSAPSLQRVLSVPATCEREAILRAEMRRTIGELSATLGEAAQIEASNQRAAVFRGASIVAARLAATTSRHDH